MGDLQAMFDQIALMQEEGVSEAQIAECLDIPVSELRQIKADAADAKKFAQIVTIVERKDKGYSNAAIAQELGLSESTVRRILTDVDEANA